MRSFCFEIIYGILLIVQKGHSTPDGQRVALNVRPLQPKRFFFAKPAVQTEGAEYAGAWFYDYTHQNIEDILVIEDGGTRKKDPRLDADLSKIINAYQANIGTWPRILTDDLQRWREQFSTEMLLLAISEGAKNGAHKWSYIESILRRWKKDNIKTPGDFEAWEAQRKPSTGQQPKRSAAEDYDEIFRELLGGSA